MEKAQGNTEQYAPIFGDFVPFPALWAQGPHRSLFPSETSARWFLRANREALVIAQAIAIHGRQTLVHPERFKTIAETVALRKAARPVERESDG
jgi:hypothetical protein